MTSNPDVLLIAFGSSLGLGLLLTPAARWVALRYRILDHPSTPIKTHREPTPYLGGLAVFEAVALALIGLRFFTHFPTGTLRSLRAVLVGGGFVAAVGLVDDMKAGGLDFRWKFFFQVVGALILVAFDIRIHFIHPDWLAVLFTVLWVVAVTNAFNLIDIMDGLSASQALTASLGFLFVAMPGEELYVNLTATALAGACLGFLPYNLSRSRKIFMGDAGSLFLGFTLAAVSMGMSYTRENDLGVLSPILILGFPLYDTFFVSTLRIVQGKSPFLGSKDHLALKLRALGIPPEGIVGLMAAVATLGSVAAFLAVRAPAIVSVFLLSAFAVVGLYAVLRLHKVKVP
jgi:UDP-GlcNAc:undecaprenyl-phosphate GlcNAc-1-phosphate transferase